jgi:hypothetical protein
VQHAAQAVQLDRFVVAGGLVQQFPEMEAVVDRRMAAGKGLAGDDAALSKLRTGWKAELSDVLKKRPAARPCSSSQTLEDVDRWLADAPGKHPVPDMPSGLLLKNDAARPRLTETITAWRSTLRWP